MKKRRFMSILAALLVLCLLTVQHPFAYANKGHDGFSFAKEDVSTKPSYRLQNKLNITKQLLNEIEMGHNYPATSVSSVALKNTINWSYTSVPEGVPSGVTAFNNKSKADMNPLLPPASWSSLGPTPFSELPTG